MNSLPAGFDPFAPRRPGQRTPCPQCVAAAPGSGDRDGRLLVERLGSGNVQVTCSDPMCSFSRLIGPKVHRKLQSKRRTVKPCAIPGCGRNGKPAYGLCHAHEARFRNGMNKNLERFIAEGGGGLIRQYRQGSKYTTCQVKGCGSKTKARGLCNTHDTRLRRSGHNSLERFIASGGGGPIRKFRLGGNGINQKGTP